MAEKDQEVPGEENPGEIIDDPVAIIDNLKKTTVSKEEYDKLKANYSKAIDALARNKQLEEVKSTPKKSIEDLRKEFLKEDQSNLEQVKSALALRDALIESGQPDPFLPIGRNIQPDEDDVKAANRVADVFRDCIEVAQGDSQVFTNELQRRTIEGGKRSVK